MKKIVFFIIALLVWNNFFAQNQRTEENFNSNWHFARYGMQADGSRIPEPGSQMRKFKFESSSEELGLSFSAYLTMDNDETTYWQPANSDQKPWIIIDLLNATFVEKANTISKLDSK